MIEFEIKGLPPMLLNTRMNWRVLDNRKMEWYGKTLMALFKAEVPLGNPFDKSIVIYTRFSGSKQPDFQNMVSGFKWIQDALIYSRVISEDNPEHMLDRYKWAPAGPKDGRVRIRVIEAQSL